MLLPQYLLVGFELLIVCSSIMALTRGANVMGRKAEAATVATCVATGIATFVTFYLVCAHIGADYNAMVRMLIGLGVNGLGFGRLEPAVWI